MRLALQNFFDLETYRWPGITPQKPSVNVVYFADEYEVRLAGAFGSEPVRRTCTVPHGKYLFFPLVTYVVMPEPGSSECDQLRAEARAMVETPSTLFAQVDGRAIDGLESRRAASAKCFNVNALSHGPNLPSASDGYWLMLRPLAPGRHTLHFGGHVASLNQDITYTLIVE